MFSSLARYRLPYPPPFIPGMQPARAVSDTLDWSVPYTEPDLSSEPPCIGMHPDTDPCPHCGASMREPCGHNPENPDVAIHLAEAVDRTHLGG